MGEEGGDIGMHQFEQAQADAEEEQAFQDFEACNQHHAGVLLLRHYAFMVVRLLEHSVWAFYLFVEESRRARYEKAEPTRVAGLYFKWVNEVSFRYQYGHPSQSKHIRNITLSSRMKLALFSLAKIRGRRVYPAAR